MFSSEHFQILAQDLIKKATKKFSCLSIVNLNAKITLTEYEISGCIFKFILNKKPRLNQRFAVNCLYWFPLNLSCNPTTSALLAAMKCSDT